jgi:hypothetical protein
MNIPKKWTAIAESYSGAWTNLPDAVLNVADATEMHGKGMILMAQRRKKVPAGTPYAPMELLIKAKKPEKKGK